MRVLPEQATPKLSVVIPAYNEEVRLGPSLQRVQDYLRGRGVLAEVIVVDDGSADGTADVARSSSLGVVVLVNEENRGKGYSVRRGALAARGDVVLFSDADFSSPIEEAEKLERAIEGGADVAVGSRAMAESDVQVHQPLHREMMGKVFNRLVQWFVFPGISDTQCGFKAFRRSAAQAIFTHQTFDGFVFDVEILYIARRLGLEVREVPVVWRDSPDSRVGPLRDSFAMFRQILRIREIHRDLHPPGD